MITNDQKKIIIENLVNLLDIPDTAYDKAVKRYEDLGDWFNREDSLIMGNDVHIYPQGSFRLGTVIRPLNEIEEFDLDLVCNLKTGISKAEHTQEYLKKLVGIELEGYRKTRGIKKELESKHRCWCLEYQDNLSFHIDIVPCIPSDEIMYKAFFESMHRTGLNDYVAKFASETAISITDDRHKRFMSICNDWNISNPEGYAKWFEYRMNPNQTISLLEKAQVDKIPLFKKRTPLQQAIQLLKRHRDNWCKDNPESKPISIIITTLAAQAYNGESDIAATLENVLRKMGNYINDTRPRVPNPVDPNEDFADRWYRADSVHLRLEDNFYSWLMQVNKDFQHLTSATDTEFISGIAATKFGLCINKSELFKQLGGSLITLNVVKPKEYIIDRQEVVKPWRK